jgi:hypothetical protein
MKMGHKKKFHFTLQQAREDLRREEEEQEEQRIEEEEQRKLEHELSKIERKRILFEAKAKARSTRDAEDQADVKLKASKATKLNLATEPAQHQAAQLPDFKEYAAFLSHKKTHTKFADSSETLSIRLKVHFLMCELVSYNDLRLFLIMTCVCFLL